MGGVRVTDHESWQDEVPAYVASRLEGEARDRFESHLRNCPACVTQVATWKEIVSALHDHGAILFEDHPSEAALRAYALAREGAGDAGIARHLATCASCELEVTAWRTRQALGLRSGTIRRRGAAIEARGGALRAPVLWLGAGLMAGLGLAVLLRLAPTSRPETRERRPAAAMQPVATWTGPVQLLVLGSPLRGQGALPTFRIEPDQPFALIAVQPALPESAGDTERYRFLIRRETGEVAWVSELDASQIRRHLETTEVVTFAVPSVDLSPGRYEMRVLPRDRQENEPLLQMPFQIVP